MSRLLLVEDDDDIREDLCDLLREEGYDVSTARDGREALEALRADPAVKLILLDLMMPRMDGWQFREEQIKDELALEVPVVLLSGSADLHGQVARLRASGCLTKPFQLERLLDVVSRYCVRATSTSA